MSNGEVKRWYVYSSEDGALYAVSKNQRGFVPDASTIEVMPVEDHERVVAELKADLVQYHRMAASGVWIPSGEYSDKIDALAKQAQVIEKARQLYVNAVALIDKLSPGGEYTMDDVLARYDKELEDAASR